MTTITIIIIASLLLLAYIFDITSSKTKIPSVILLLLVGWALKQAATFLQVHLPDFSVVLPIFGTLGLILIVLEGSLSLELNKSKFGLVRQSAMVAFLPMLVFCLVLAWAFYYFGNASFKIALANAIPFGVISSAIAIPSVQHQPMHQREFVTYESSLSDIFGVLLFNFIALNETIGLVTVFTFTWQLLLMLIVSFISILLLTLLLNKIVHHIKFVPIICMVVLIYAIAKHFHLPALIFILLFGLFIGNLENLKAYRFVQLLHSESLIAEVQKFKELTTEIAFLVRVIFFLLFGFSINTNQLLNAESILWAIGICIFIFALRYMLMRIYKLSLQPLLFIAPRGLITILLFLSIPASQSIVLANTSLVIQVIILTAVIMMVGLMLSPSAKRSDSH